MTMDRLDSMRLFVRVIERQSFSEAAADLAIPRSTASTAIRALENRLGVALLTRTTRHVSATLDGEAYYRRCVDILAEVEDAETVFHTREAQGLLRIDANASFVRRLLAPQLPKLMEQHPDLKLHIGAGDRYVDLVREGVDCVIRGGEIDDSDMIVRRLGVLREITCASPAYLAKHGIPETPDDLEGHEMIGFVSSRTADVMPLEFTQAGKLREIRLPARVTVSNADTIQAMALQGYGLAQSPYYGFRDHIESGALVEILADYPPAPLPISVLYPSARNLSPRVRIFVDWLISEIAPQLETL